MRALVIYETMFGNTKRVADAIADGIADSMPVECIEVSTAPHVIEADIDLLIVGGPTHVHGMTTARTRADAAKRATAGVVSDRIGMREWLEQARPAAGTTRAAAFDTRINGPALLTGSAAGGFAKRLGAAGFRLMAPAKSFLVTAKAPQENALLEGEVENAREWGRALAAQIPAKVALA